MDLLLYIVINFIFNVMILVVIRVSSTTLMYIAGTVRLPLANIAFTFTWVMGKKYAQKLSMFDIVGLVVVVLGLVLYKFGRILWSLILARLCGMSEEKKEFLDKQNGKWENDLLASRPDDDLPVITVGDVDTFGQLPPAHQIVTSACSRDSQIYVDP
jgi:hypothetical protein